MAIIMFLMDNAALCDLVSFLIFVYLFAFSLSFFNSPPCSFYFSFARLFVVLLTCQVWSYLKVLTILLKVCVSLPLVIFLANILTLFKVLHTSQLLS